MPPTTPSLSHCLPALELTSAHSVVVVVRMWHRAEPHLPGGAKNRRMILIQWAPPEGRRSPLGRATKPPAPNPVSRLLEEAGREGDTETLELLGKGGYQ